MNKTVYAIHTGPVLLEIMKELFAELLPGVRLVNIVDDGLLTDVRAAAGVTAQVRRRLVGYGLIAESSGADAILNCCSSVGEVADVLATFISIPLVKIDDRMAQVAVDTASNIGIVATVATTLDPTERLVHRKASERGKTVKTARYLANTAFDALIGGDAIRHDQLLKTEILRAASENEVVVLAQGSMARLVPQLTGETNVPVLSSPRLGVAALRDVLGAR
jgi:Asp/Glu/hydantoin racemase